MFISNKKNEYTPDTVLKVNEDVVVVMATVKISRGSSSVHATVNIKLLAVVLSGKVTVESRLEKVGELPETMQRDFFSKISF